MKKTFLRHFSIKTMFPTFPMFPPTFLVTSVMSVMSVTLKQSKTLTKNKSAANLSTHCKSSVGFCSSFSKGDNTPIIKSVFLCLPFSGQSNFGRFNSIMTVLSVGRNPVAPLRDTANSFNTVTRLFAVLCDGFTLLSKGITA